MEIQIRGISLYTTQKPHLRNNIQYCNNPNLSQKDSFVKSANNISFKGELIPAAELKTSIKHCILSGEELDMTEHLKSDEAFKHFFVSLHEVLDEFNWRLSSAKRWGNTEDITKAEEPLKKSYLFWKKFDNSEKYPGFVQRFLNLHNPKNEEDSDMVHEVINITHLGAFC